MRERERLGGRESQRERGCRHTCSAHIVCMWVVPVAPFVCFQKSRIALAGLLTSSATARCHAVACVGHVARCTGGEAGGAGSADAASFLGLGA